MSRVDPATFCRASADTSRHLEQQAQAEQFAKSFDPFDEALMHDVCGNDNMAKPISALLQTLHTIRLTESSFGVDRDDAKAQGFDILRPKLEALEEACKREFEKL